ncbi:MAG: hypothetical protein ACM3JH_12920 [Acidithiobacillales bacterium]
MLKIVRILLLAAAFVSPISLQAQAPKKAPMRASDMVAVTVTVEAIDSATRTLTVKAPGGDYVDLEVPETVKRFSEIKVGDQIRVKYYESIAVEVKKAGEATPGKKVEGGITREPGKKPSGKAARKVTVAVTIVSIDAKAPSVTVKGEDGHTRSFRIEDPKNLEGVKPGDHVVVTYTEALAIEVVAPKS